MTEIPQAECEALVALYDSTGGPNWTDKETNNWKVTNTPCSWTGVKCENGHVTEIDRCQNLNGTLPDKIKNLTFLIILDLRDNYYHPGWHWFGSRNSCWSDRENHLTGNLPNLANLISLTVLNLASNKFDGSINTSWLPPNLQSLYLQQYSGQFYMRA